MPIQPVSPQKLGRYELVARLATGGMAEIFLARETGPAGLERPVVVKRILQHLAADEEFVQLFLQEARIAARLSHPNIVQIHELGEAEGAYFLAMEYVRGPTVRRLAAETAAQGRPFPPGVAVAIALQACEGAHAAHELTDSEGRPLGIVHRDISPQNLMVTGEGHVKLLDFGIAKPTAASEATRSGGLKGKLEYLSPEQCRQEPLDRRSDVFALGITVWELLAQQPLFRRPSDLETLQAVDAAQVPDLRVLRPELPGPVVRALARALARERDERYPTADAFRRELSAAALRCGLDVTHDAAGAFVREVMGAAIDRETHELESSLRTPSRPFVPAGSAPTAPPSAAGTPPRGSRADDRPTRAEPATSRRPPPRRPNARRVAAAVGGACLAAALLVLAVLATREPARVIAGPEITLGFPPSTDAEPQRRELEALREWLQQRTGRPVRFEVTASYEDLARRVVAGELHFGSFPAFLYVTTHERQPTLTPLLLSLFDGSTGNNGLVLAPEDSTIQGLTDLRGKRMCLTDPHSTTGFVLPRAALARAGVDPEKDLAQVHLSGSHLQAVRDLLAGHCDAAATFDKAYLVADGAGLPAAKLRVIGTTGHAPNDSICAGGGTPASDQALVRNALLAFVPERDVGRPVLGPVTRISGFRPVDDTAYDALRKALAAPAPPPAVGTIEAAP